MSINPITTWRSFNIFHIKVSGKPLADRVLDGPAPDQVRLVRHQDDGERVKNLRPPQRRQHPGGGVEALLVVHRHHHQHRVGTVGGQLRLQGHLSLFVIDEQETGVFVVHGHVHLFAHAVV